MIRCPDQRRRAGGNRPAILERYGARFPWPISATSPMLSTISARLRQIDVSGICVPKISLPMRLALLVAGTTLPLIIFAAAIIFDDYEQDPARRHPARARNRAQHPPGARRRSAAHDRRLAGAGADRRAAQRRFRGVSADRLRIPRTLRQGRCGAGGRPRWPPVIFVSHDGYRQSAPRNNLDSVEKVFGPGARNTRICSSAPCGRGWSSPSRCRWFATAR